MHNAGKWQELGGRLPTVIAAFIGITFGISAIYFYTTGFFIKPLQAEFGWSRTQVSLAMIAGTIATAIASPFVGALVDRMGARLIGCISLVCLSLGFLALSQLGPSIWVFALLGLLISVGGAGTSPVTFTRMIAARFLKARGLALGLALSGTGVAGALVPRLFGPYIDAAGWRAGYQALFLAVLVAVPFVWLLGRPRERHEGKNAAPGLSFSAVVASVLFRRLAVAFVATALAIGGFIVHLVPLLTDAGFSVPAAGKVAMTVGLFVIIGRLGCGYALDHISPSLVALGIFGAAALGCLLLATIGVEAAYVAAAMVGLALGAEVDLIGYITARQFGLKAYGAVYGLLYSAFLVGMAFSPLLYAASFDILGSYRAALYVAAAMLTLAITLLWSLPRPDAFET